MKKNVAGQNVGAQLTTASDGSPFTGAVTVEVTIDAGSQATGTVGAGAAAHEGSGYHTYAPSQAETNGDLLAFTFHGTGAISVTIQASTILWQDTQAIKAITDKLDALLEATSPGPWRYTAEALEAAPNSVRALRRGVGGFYPFVMRQTVDSKLGAPGLLGVSPPLTAQRSLDGGTTWTTMVNAATIAEIDDGAYVIEYDPADIDGFSVIFRFSAATAVDAFVTHLIEQPA